MRNKNNTASQKLALFALAGAMMLGMIAPKANAQNNKKDHLINKIANVLKPDAVSVSFGCIHWGGDTYQAKGAFLGEYQGYTGWDTEKKQIVVGAIRNGYYNDQNVTTLHNMYKTGDLSGVYIESAPAKDTPLQTHYSLYEIDNIKFNQTQNWGVFADYNLGGFRNTQFNLQTGVFNNSYYNPSALVSLGIRQENLFRLNGLSGGIHAGVVSGYKEEQVGKIAYIGHGFSSMAGLSLGYTLRNGLGVEVDITPAFATVRMRLAIGNKNDERGLLSFLHNRKEQEKLRSRDQNLARLSLR